MIKVQSFTFNGFQENTYVLSDETKDCVIIDPGCYSSEEQQTLVDYIEANQLVPTKLLNTHCHIDHILGNHFVANRYNIGLEMHEKDLPTLHATPEYGHLYGFNVTPSPEPTTLLNEGDNIIFGNSSLTVLFAPGHSSGHIVFYSEQDAFVIAGDVLFNGSIGRTDLPGGDYDTLIDSIKTKLMPLNDNVTVYCGHGPSTTIGHERMHNPFINS